MSINNYHSRKKGFNQLIYFIDTKRFVGRVVDKNVVFSVFTEYN